MRAKRCVRVLDIENAIDRSWIGQVGDLDEPSHPFENSSRPDSVAQPRYFELTTHNQSMNMRAISVVPGKGRLDTDTLRVTSTTGEVFVFEIVSSDEYGLLGNGRRGGWYTEVEEQITTEKKWLIIDHPALFPEQVRIPLDNATQDLADLIDALQQTKKDLED
jgi:hypothetical protein